MLMIVRRTAAATVHLVVSFISCSGGNFTTTTPNLVAVGALLPGSRLRGTIVVLLLTLLGRLGRVAILRGRLVPVLWRWRCLILRRRLLLVLLSRLLVLHAEAGLIHRQQSFQILRNPAASKHDEATVVTGARLDSCLHSVTTLISRHILNVHLLPLTLWVIRCVSLHQS